MTADAYQRRVFGSALARARREAGVSQVQLARWLDVTAWDVKGWEAGEDHPTAAVTARLERAVLVDEGRLGELLGFLSNRTQRRAVRNLLLGPFRLGPERREWLSGHYRELVEQRAADRRWAEGLDRSRSRSRGMTP